jgi:hypothetical protein
MSAYSSQNAATWASEVRFLPDLLKDEQGATSGG